MERQLGIAGLVVGLVLMAGAAEAADQQIRAFFGATFAGETTFVDLENAAGQAHLTIGGQAAWLGEIFGAEGEVADTPGFFEGGKKNLVIKSRVTTFTGNFVIAVPRRLTEYSLRLYFVGGGGIMRVREEDALAAYDFTKYVPAIDFGVGALGFLTNRVGLSWELRRFQQVGDTSQPPGISFGTEHLSYWRANMAVVIRY